MIRELALPFVLLMGGLALLSLNWREFFAWSAVRSEEHTSELQSLMRSSYAVFCLKKKQQRRYTDNTTYIPDIIHITYTLFTTPQQQDDKAPAIMQHNIR